ncbi:uncharacterized protein LOC142767679 isoform X3 [Rhipicephalus microplus]|uniref:uncharacterized protein LOC142767679 isoform X3 n=1 Tax=Rhipicephalus microplus TaxID=6941 RepID=UPI003F6A618A
MRPLFGDRVLMTDAPEGSVWYEMPPSSDNFKLFLPVYMREKNVDLEQKTRSGSSPQKRASTLQAPEALFDRNSKVTVWH